MLEEKLKKFKDMFLLKKEENNKKKIENLVVFIVILVITIILINTIWNSDEEIAENKESSDKVLAKTQTIQKNTNNVETNELETNLENILQNIEGVGKVKVLLTYSQSSQTIAMYNEDSSQSDTEETDSRSEEIEK